MDRYLFKIILSLVTVISLLFASAVYGQTPAEKEIIILSIGDSITAGSYPERLQSKLNKADIRVEVLNCGMGGYTSGAYLRFMKSLDLFKIVKPDIILMQLGTNDVRMGSAYLETDQFAKNMESIVHLIKGDLYGDKDPPLVLISTILPIKVKGLSTSAEKSIQKAVERINADIRALSDKSGLPLLDNFALFKNHPEWLIDGVHPNEEGYQAMADNWFGLLTKVIAGKSVSSGKAGFIP